MATMNIPSTERRHIPERRTTASGAGHNAGLSAVGYIAMALLIVGGLNWALVGLLSFDLVATLFGTQSTLTRLVYILVGVSALYAIYLVSRWGSRSDG
ncbi:hypothetical protein CR103_07960 [Massilia psychrophila]|jgi:hypothetical protein|uniref:DUF378 domain-containing protein n=2 Tax=Massilia psychrophila TaxID=1603353 RepID=A0A2G8T2Z4_9BURK|nr:hypothetical protein CR103_07960 [Massilia psychrophila]